MQFIHLHEHELIATLTMYTEFFTLLYTYHVTFASTAQLFSGVGVIVKSLKD